MKTANPEIQASRPDVGRCITYGTFDLFHKGHLRLLERARLLSSYLIVGITSDSFDATRGKLNVRQSLIERIEGVQKCGLADQIIIEEYEGQKMQDIIKYNVGIFAIGSDWTGHFDYLKRYCQVVYLERTVGVSSTELRGELRLGIIGSGRIAQRFMREAKFVSGVRISAVMSRSKASAAAFAAKTGIYHSFDNLEQLWDVVDAVYIASPHLTHYSYAKKAIEADKHILCEKPLCLAAKETMELYLLASQRQVVLLEAIKTAFMPAFRQMMAVAQNGTIGSICSVSATCTMLKDPTTREFDPAQAGGSISELASYPLFAIVKILGHEKIEPVGCHSLFNSMSGVDIFSRIDLIVNNALATATIGLGAKAEGDLVIAGTKGYIHVPAPWWLMDSFQVRFEDATLCREVRCPMEGDGLRYELAEFIEMIYDGRRESPCITAEESCAISKCMEHARANFRLIKVDGSQV